MNVKEFVSDTLEQIMTGVKDAQKLTKTSGATIVPYNKTDSQIGFDVATTVSEAKEAGGKAGVTVFSIGAGVTGKFEASNSIVSRIAFSIPVDFPKGSEPPNDLPENTGISY